MLPEQPGNADRDGEGWVVLAGLDCIHRLAIIIYYLLFIIIFIFLLFPIRKKDKNKGKNHGERKLLVVLQYLLI